VKRWYRVRITARRIGQDFMIQEMIADVEAHSTREAIETARRNNRTTIERCYQKRGRRYAAERLGTTEELVNNS
jgi:hypothetical protein